MRERFISTEHAEYQAADWDGTPPPFKPLRDNVVVLLDQMFEKSSGGVWFAEATKDQNNRAAETGIIVALGPDAFLYNMDRTRKYSDEDRPKIGDRVSFGKYSGQFRMRNGVSYAIMSDTCIGCTEEPDEREATEASAA